MLGLSTALLALALLLGGWLAISALRRVAPPKLVPALLHGLLAVAGYALLLLALGGPSRAQAAGAESFGRVAAIILALAAAPGLLLFAQHLRGRRLAGGLIGTHASLAITGFVILLTYWLLA
jgi:hypothetical protein